MDSWRVLDFNCTVPRVTQVLNKNRRTCSNTDAVIQIQTNSSLPFRSCSIFNETDAKHYSTETHIHQVATCTLHEQHLDANYAHLI